MDIKEISEEIHQNNVDKGFWNKDRNIGEMLMLVVSELSEALEADRKGIQCNLSRVAQMNLMGQIDDETFKRLFVSEIKDTFEDEIADAVIRLFDLAEGLNIDLEWHIAAKMRYNKSRPKMHGKAY